MTSEYHVLTGPDAEKLLSSYQPLFVLLPQDPERQRPGAWWHRANGRSDYHPVSAQFFLSLVTQRDEPRPYSLNPFARKGSKEPTGLEELRRRVAAANGDTLGWEIDIGPIKSRDPRQAWRVYQELLRTRHEAKEPITYARAVERDNRIVLQYWLLYLYNDAANTHEGDWEMASVEVAKATGEPVQVAYSGHEGGARRSWPQIDKINGRPLVLIARGSHAAYVNHVPLGNHVAKIGFNKTLPLFLKKPIEAALGLPSRVFFFLGVRDHTPAFEGKTMPPKPGEGYGVAVDAELRYFPAETAPVSDAEWWWMNLHCNWGSRHAALRSFAAPVPPWRQSKWNVPLEWLDLLPLIEREADEPPLAL